MNWEMSSYVLGPLEEKFIRIMARYLEDTPEASITIIPEEYTEKEVEKILLFEGKKKYYLSRNNMKAASLTAKDSTTIKKNVDQRPRIRFLPQ